MNATSFFMFPCCSSSVAALLMGNLHFSHQILIRGPTSLEEILDISIAIVLRSIPV